MSPPRLSSDGLGQNFNEKCGMVHGHGQLKQGCFEYTKILYGNQYFTSVQQFYHRHIFLRNSKKCTKRKQDYCVVAKNTKWRMFCVTAVSPWRGGGLWPNLWNRQSRLALRGARTSIPVRHSPTLLPTLEFVTFWERKNLLQAIPTNWYPYQPDNWISSLRSQSFDLVEIVTSEYKNIFCNDNIEMSSCSAFDSESLLKWHIFSLTFYQSWLVINRGGGIYWWYMWTIWQTELCQRQKRYWSYIVLCRWR